MMSRVARFNAKTGAVEFFNLPDLGSEEAERQMQSDRASVKRTRKAAFEREADPLFFKWQAGEATQEEWETARQSIRDRYPYPGE